MHYTVLAGGLQYLGSNTLRLSEGGSDDIVAALDAVLSLARELVMKGAWWQEAKAHHPVLLIETLYMVTKVRQPAIQENSPLHKRWPDLQGLLDQNAQLKYSCTTSVVLPCR
jgi:hypothetical protein